MEYHIFKNSSLYYIVARIMNMIYTKDHIHNSGGHFFFSPEYIEYDWKVVNIAGIL